MPQYARRPLTETEESVLAALLAQEFPGVESLRQQAKNVEAAKGCECGCATIDLFTDRQSAAPSSAASPLPAEADVLDEAGEPIGGILIFLKDGYLAELEVYSYGREPIAEFPAIERLRVNLLDRSH